MNETQKTPAETATDLVALVLVLLLYTWIVMLALGNFGFTEFSFWSSIPPAIILRWFSAPSRRRD